jgi:hypothetical protein
MRAERGKATCSESSEAWTAECLSEKELKGRVVDPEDRILESPWRRSSSCSLRDHGRTK